MPQVGNIVAVAYSDRFGKNKEVKVGRITNIIIPFRCENIPTLHKFEIQILSGARSSVITAERTRFKTIEEIQEYA